MQCFFDIRYEVNNLEFSAIAETGITSESCFVVLFLGQTYQSKEYVFIIVSTAVFAQGAMEHNEKFMGFGVSIDLGSLTSSVTYQMCDFELVT